MSASHESRDGLSWPAVVISGIIAALFFMAAFLTIRHMGLGGLTANADNTIEQLIRQKKFDQALANLEKKGGKGRKDVEDYIAEAKIWMALAWEKQNRDGWRSYGTNRSDWLNVVEADRAEQALKKALQKDADNVEAHYQLGNLYMERGWHSRAEARFLSALRREPDHIESRINLGVLYTRLDKADLARHELLEAYRMDPDNPSIFKNLAFLYRFSLDHPESSMIWANRYMNAAPASDFDVNAVRRELLEMLDRYPEYAPREPMKWKQQRFPERK